MAAAPGYALSDSSASTASQTSFTCRTTYYTKGVPIRLHKGSALGCLPERTLQPAAILCDHLRRPPRTRATAHHSVLHLSPAHLRPVCLPWRCPQGSVGVNGIDREARERTRDARPGLSGVVRATLLTILIVHIVSWMRALASRLPASILPSGQVCLLAVACVACVARRSRSDDLPACAQTGIDTRDVWEWKGKRVAKPTTIRDGAL